MEILGGWRVYVGYVLSFLTLLLIYTCNIFYMDIIFIIFNYWDMPTQLDSNWLPWYERKIDSDMQWWVYKTSQVSKKVLEILEILTERTIQWWQYFLKLKNIKDGHSSLLSDDLLWYIKWWLTTDERLLIEQIKIKWDNIVIPRELSTKIQKTINTMK